MGEPRTQGAWGSRAHLCAERVELIKHTWRVHACITRNCAGSVSCKAATAWDSWTSYISKHRTDSQAKTATKAETSINKCVCRQFANRMASMLVQ
jgi:hypothetical protein